MLFYLSHFWVFFYSSLEWIIVTANSYWFGSTTFLLYAALWEMKSARKSNGEMDLASARPDFKLWLSHWVHYVTSSVRCYRIFRNSGVFLGSGLHFSLGKMLTCAHTHTHVQCLWLCEPVFCTKEWIWDSSFAIARTCHLLQTWPNSRLKPHAKTSFWAIFGLQVYFT